MLGVWVAQGIRWRPDITRTVTTTCVLHVLCCTCRRIAFLGGRCPLWGRGLLPWSFQRRLMSCQCPKCHVASYAPSPRCVYGAATTVRQHLQPTEEVTLSCLKDSESEELYAGKREGCCKATFATGMYQRLLR